MSQVWSRTRKVRLTLGWLVGSVLGLVLLAIVGVLAAVWFGVSIDLSGQRPRITALMSEKLGRPVTIGGQVLLNVSLSPTLQLADLRIAQPPGFDPARPMATIGQATLALEAVPLLTSNRLVVHEFSGSNVRLNLQVRADSTGQHNNWTMGPRSTTPSVPPASTGSTPPSPSAADKPDAPAHAALGGVNLAVQRLSLTEIAVEYQPAQGRPHFFELTSVLGEAPADAPMHATLEGRIERQFPYRAELTGGRLDALLAHTEPWPVQATMTFFGSTITLDGKLFPALFAGTAGTPMASVEFGIGTPDLVEVERLLGTRLPKVGATALAGNLHLFNDQARIDSLTLIMGATAASGALEVQWSGAHPRLAGKLALSTLDMRPFLQEEAKDPEPPKSLAQWYRDASRAEFDLSMLRGFDADLELSVQKWLSLPGDVRDVTMKVALHDGRLKIPMSAQVTGVRLEGELEADGTSSPPSVAATFGARDSPLGGLAELLFNLRGIEGKLGGLALRATGQGNRVGELFRKLDARVVMTQARLSYGNRAGDASARPVNFSMDSMTLTLPPNKPLAVVGTGSLLDQPLSFSVAGGTLERMISGVVPLQVQADSRTLKFRANGEIEMSGSAPKTRMQLVVQADRASDAARWFNVRVSRQVPLGIQATLLTDATSWTVKDGLVKLGRNEAKINATYRPGPQRSIIDLSVSAETVDMAEIDTLLTRAPRRSERTQSQAPVPPKEPTALLDIPVLPARINLSDANVTLAIGRITNAPVDVADLKFSAAIREGKLPPSPFSVRLYDAAFTGAIAADLRDESPGAEGWLLGENIDIGRILKRLKLAQGVEATAEQLRLHLQGEGAQLGELLAQARAYLEMEGGRVNIVDANTGARARIRVTQASLKADPGQPVTLDLDGRMDRVPVTMKIRSGTLVDLVTPDKRIPFDLDARLAQATLKLSGSLARQDATRDIELKASLAGEKLDALDRLVRVSLPPWGPYALDGRLRVTRQGYVVDELKMRVGTSHLIGKGSLDTSKGKPVLDVALNAPNVQLDDFKLGKWWPFEARTPTPGTLAPTAPATLAETSDALRARAQETTDQAEQLLSANVIRAQDIHLQVKVGQVLSGDERLGSGELVAHVQGGKAQIGPVNLQIPGGSAQFGFSYEPREGPVKAVEVSSQIRLDKFDYGILARRIQSDAQAQGRLSLDFQMQSQAPSLAEALKNANGHIDFTIWPRNIDGAVFDMWAANLFVALASKVDPSSASKINCGFASFDLANGQLKQKELMLDTTRVRVKGEVSADFKAEKIHVRLDPSPKKAQFFSLATPVQVDGNFRDFAVGVNPGDVIATVGRLVTSLLWVPIQKMFGKEVPADGADVCNR